MLYDYVNVRDVAENCDLSFFLSLSSFSFFFSVFLQETRDSREEYACERQRNDRTTDNNDESAADIYIVETGIYS